MRAFISWESSRRRGRSPHDDGGVGRWPASSQSTLPTAMREPPSTDEVSVVAKEQYVGGRWIIRGGSKAMVDMGGDDVGGIVGGDPHVRCGADASAPRAPRAPPSRRRPIRTTRFTSSIGPPPARDGDSAGAAYPSRAATPRSAVRPVEPEHVTAGHQHRPRLASPPQRDEGFAAERRNWPPHHGRDAVTFEMTRNSISLTASRSAIAPARAEGLPGINVPVCRRLSTDTIGASSLPVVGRRPTTFCPRDRAFDRHGGRPGQAQKRL